MNQLTQDQANQLFYIDGENLRHKRAPYNIVPPRKKKGHKTVLVKGKIYRQDVIRYNLEHGLIKDGFTLEGGVVKRAHNRDRQVAELIYEIKMLHMDYQRKLEHHKADARRLREQLKLVKQYAVCYLKSTNQVGMIDVINGMH